jgi:hypothetical protein
MSHSYASCWEKVKRADGQIADLHRQIELFLMNPIRSVPRCSQIDPQTVQDVVRLHSQRDVPLRFSVIAGEIIHDLRSSLDHAAWQLVIANGRKPSRQTSFPTFLQKPAANTIRANRYAACVEGMSARARAVIEQLQPYRDQSPEDNLLGILTRLWNRDKHRQLNIIAAVVTGVSKIRLLHDIPDDGADAETAPSSQDVQMDLGGKLTVRAAFDEFGSLNNDTVTESLSKVSDEVRETITMIAKLIPEQSG